MGLSVSDLITATKICFEEKIHYYDPLCAPSPWRDQDFQAVAKRKTPLKIGILNELDYMPCSTASRRAVNIAAEAFERLGYQVVEFNWTQEFW